MSRVVSRVLLTTSSAIKLLTGIGLLLFMLEVWYARRWVRGIA